jgi:NADPH-dependent 7-cyano-7-deazaguanine reductase QueF
MLTFEDVLWAAETATREIKVLVPSNCYYASKGDFDEDHITYIDGKYFVELLKEKLDA